MSECGEHAGEYRKSASCLKCLALYWMQHYKDQKAHIATLEAQLAEIKGLPEKWKKETQEPVSTDEGYCINGAYQACFHQLQAILDKYAK